MISFALSDEQKALREVVRSFARTHLASASSLYNLSATSSLLTPQGRFRSTRPIFEAAVKAGILKSQVPVPLGGTGGSVIDAALAVEELYAVESSISLTILANGLGSSPIILGGSVEQKERWLKPFITGEGAPLASLVFSEPGGSANYLEPGSRGLQTTARLEGDEWVIDGEKIWATNCSGWDDRGADIQCVVCRVVESPNAPASSTPRDQIAIIVVTRSDIAANPSSAYTVLSHPDTVGHTAVNGPHIRFSSLRVPSFNLLAPPGHGASIVEMAFTASGAMVGAMGVGIMRRAFEKAWAWASSEMRGSKERMVEKQSVADLLIRMKIRCEAARGLTWRACEALEGGRGGELAYEAKIFGSEGAVETVMDAINLVGVSSYSREMGLSDLLNDAVALPIFDGGNVGIRRRQLQAIFSDPDYEPLAVTYGKDRE